MAHGLTDSPVGLMAYILEKYSGWSFDYDTQVVGKRDGALSKFNKDDLLSIVTIYWMSNSISSSVRYYKANIDSTFITKGFKKEMGSATVSAKIPVGFQLSVNEVMVTPSRVAQMRFPNMTQFKLVDTLGHFAAFHDPLTTANNFVRFVLNSL